MNCAKTEFMMFGSKQQLSMCSTKDININGDIERVPVIRYLSVWLDQQLNLKVHISKKCQIAMINLQKKRFIRHFLTREATEILVISLVMSHIDYSNSILYGVTNQEQKMQRIQNMCVKVVLQKKKYDSSTQALKGLHWLPAQQCINFKILSFVYKCRNGSCPKYLADLLHENPVRHNYY